MAAREVLDRAIGKADQSIALGGTPENNGIIRFVFADIDDDDDSGEDVPAEDDQDTAPAPGAAGNS